MRFTYPYFIDNTSSTISKVKIPINVTKRKSTELVLRNGITVFLIILHILKSKHYVSVVLAISGFFVLYNHFLKIKVFRNWEERKTFSFSALFYCWMNQPSFLGVDRQCYDELLYLYLLENNDTLLKPLCEAIAYALTNPKISELHTFKELCTFLLREQHVSRNQLKNMSTIHWFTAELRYLTKLIETFLAEYASLSLPPLGDSEIAERLNIYIMTNMQSWVILSHSIIPFPDIFFARNTSTQ